MVDHFHEQVMAAGKIGGQARAMVVTSGIERAIQYFHAFKAYLAERKSPYQAIVAFSGEHEYGGAEGQRGVAQRLFRAATSPGRFRPTRTAS
jgi:type I restriction enzyme R subunit